MHHEITPFMGLEANALSFFHSGGQCSHLGNPANALEPFATATMTAHGLTWGNLKRFACRHLRLSQKAATYRLKRLTLPAWKVGLW